MKTKDVLILLGAFAFSFLFFYHSHGINYAVFNFFLVASFVILQPKIIFHKRWWVAVIAVLITSVSMSLYGNALSFLGVLGSWLLIGSCTHNPQASFVLNFAQSFSSFLVSTPAYIKACYYSSIRRKKGVKNTPLTAYVLVLGVVAIFILLYSQASTTFGKIVSDVDFSFIAFDRVITIALGFVFCASLFISKRIPFFDFIELRWARPLGAVLGAEAERLKNKIEVELKSGRLLLLLLNIVLLAVIISDVVSLFGFETSAARFNYSQLVHDNVWALIASIVFAIAILLFFFRGQLNFEPKAKLLYHLAILWVAQNLVLVATGVYKNALYIDVFDGLTYKRIGVYFFLGLCIIGLLTTAYKIIARKPNWYLVRVNFILFFSVLVLSTLFSWDNIITRFNLEKARQEGKDPDISYMIDLGNHNLPLLVEWAKKASQTPESVKSYSHEQVVKLCDALYIESHRFTRTFKYRSWQSWNLYDQKTYNYLQQVDWSKINTTQPKLR